MEAAGAEEGGVLGAAPPPTSRRGGARAALSRGFRRRPAPRARPEPRLAARRERAESGGGPAPATKRRRSRREEARAAAPRPACGPGPPAPRPTASRPLPGARAGNHGRSERAAGPLPHGRPGRRPGGHSVRRGRRAALPDRAEVSARGPRGLGPPPSPRSGPLRGRTAPPCPRGRGVEMGARPVRPRAGTRSACPRPPGGWVGNVRGGGAAAEWVRGFQECGAGEDGQRVGYKLPPPRRRVPAEPRDLRGRPTPTPAPDTLRESAAEVGLRSCPPSALLRGHTLGWTDTSWHFLVGSGVVLIS